MTYTKEPAAQGASARRAVVEVDRATGFTDLPLLPDEGMVEPSRLGRDDKVTRSEEEDGRSLEDRGSREEIVVRRQRLKSRVSITDIKRVLAAAAKVDWPVTSMEVRTDGTILLHGGGDKAATGDVFSAWADKL